MSAATLTPPPVGPAGPATTAPFGGMAFIRRFTVDEYHELIRSGMLGPEDRVELLDGYLVLKMAHGSRHDGAIAVLNRRLVRAVPDEWTVRPQLAATLPESEPEPDLLVARGGDAAYFGRHPSPIEVGLLIEVSDSSLARDTREKLQIYARDGIPVYWVVNIPDRRIEVYTDPDPAAVPPAYRIRAVHPVGSTVPVVLDGVTVGQITVADVLPAATEGDA